MLQYIRHLLPYQADTLLAELPLSACPNPLKIVDFREKLGVSEFPKNRGFSPEFLLSLWYNYRRDRNASVRTYAPANPRHSPRAPCRGTSATALTARPLALMV